MKAKQFLIITQKEAPVDAEIISHKLMMRAGLIKKMGSGIYTYMPMGLRVIRKVENIIRNAMNNAGAMECSMPMVQPADLWQETGRFEKFGEELLRFKDRHDNDFVLQPTSEEVVTAIVRADIKSHKQLPINLYQIQTKFRDERRPRFGIMRGREFTMKDAYSFDKDDAGMRASYEKMFAAYHNIFKTLGLEYRAVDADTGSIGGVGSCEFHVIAQTGEDELVYCANSDFAANIEAAPAPCLIKKRQLPIQNLCKTATPNASSCEQVACLLNIDISHTVKSLVVASDNLQEDGSIKTKIYLLLLRGDHTLNEVKLRKLAIDNIKELSDYRWATTQEIAQYFNTEPGYIGPSNNISKEVYVIADTTVANMHDFVCGANTAGFHNTGCNWGIDMPEPNMIADIRNALAGDASPDGHGILSSCRGIEVGHVFMLGTRYSEDMKAHFIDVDGKSKPMVMGCYGIGVTRILGAAIEQNFDERGIIWPQNIAPFEVVICPIAYDKSEKVKQIADSLYNALKALNVDVVLDDRGERPGSMFADWELIGIPHRITIGDKGLEQGIIEYQARKGDCSSKIMVNQAANMATEILSIINLQS
jgi:prolyl-tRNA synthetase